jgi:hypothetical protein
LCCLFFQAAIVDQIEYNVQKAKDFVDSGKSNLGEAQQKQSAARKASNLFDNNNNNNIGFPIQHNCW